MKPVTEKYEEIMNLKTREEELAFMRSSKENHDLWLQAHQEKRIRENLDFLVAVIADVAKDISEKYKLSPSGAYSALDLAVKMMQNETMNEIYDHGLNVNTQ